MFQLIAPPFLILFTSCICISKEKNVSYLFIYLYSLFHATIDPLKSLTLPRSCYSSRFSGFVSVSIYEHSFYIHYFLRTINNQYLRLVSNKWFLIKAQFVTSILKWKRIIFKLIFRQTKKIFLLQIAFLTKIQNRISEKNRKKFFLLSFKKFVKTQFLGVVEFPSIF